MSIHYALLILATLLAAFTILFSSSGSTVQSSPSGSARDVKKNVVQSSSGSIPCIGVNSWTAPSYTHTHKIIRCVEGPYAYTTKINTTISKESLRAASLIYQLGYIRFLENSSDPVFQITTTASSTHRFGIDASLVTKNPDGLNEDRFLHRSEYDRILNDGIRNGYYHVTNEVKQMVFVFAYANGTMVIAKGIDILSSP